MKNQDIGILNYYQIYKFLKWIEEVINIDPKNTSFLLNDFYPDEINIWYNWYLKGLSPFDAIDRNYYEYG